MLRSSREVLVVVAAAAIVLGAAGPAYAGSGDVDRTFGDSGTVVLEGSQLGENLYGGVEIAPAGQRGGLWVTGTSADSYTGLSGFTILTKLLADGDADAAFSGDGERYWRFSRRGAYPETLTKGVESVPGGGMQITGQFAQHPEGDLATWFTARFLANGRMDHTFGHKGTVRHRVGTRWSVKTVTAEDGSTFGCALTTTDRLRVWSDRADGSPNVDFADDGTARVHLPKRVDDWDQVAACGLTADGKVVAVIEGSTVYMVHQTALVRLTAGGLRDETLSGNGVKVVPEAPVYPDAAVVKPNGGVLFSFGYREESGADPYPAVYALRPDGNPDLSFGGGDALVVIDGSSARYCWFSRIVIGPGSAITLAGGVAEGSFVARLNADGDLDSTYSDDGVTTGFGPPESYANFVALDAHQRVVVSNSGEGVALNTRSLTRLQR